MVGGRVRFDTILAKHISSRSSVPTRRALYVLNDDGPKDILRRYRAKETVDVIALELSVK